MPQTPEPQSVGSHERNDDDGGVGRHRLGPHVIGRRVVVRRLLRGETGPTGGPAFTDLLGTCVAWGDGVCVVRPEHGDAVTIPLADLVSGKPVPPRASARLRVSPADAQRRFALFPGLETEPLGDWTLRHHPTATARRANSVLALGPSGTGRSPEDDEARVRAWYAARGRRPIAAVLVDGPGDSPEATRLGEQGWVAESADADTAFLIASVAAALRAVHAGRPVAELEVVGTPDGLLAVEHPHARGRLAVLGDDAAIGGLAVDEDHRRRGLGRAVVAALLERAAELGARTASLQVLADNAPALALYEALGFVEHHRYRYLAAPEA